jgi:hypothetical protein
MYLPMTVEANLRPIVGSPPMIFKSCLNGIRVSRHYGKFNDIYEQCSGGSSTPTTIEWETTTTTEMSTIEDSVNVTTDEWEVTDEAETTQNTTIIDESYAK